MGADPRGADMSALFSGFERADADVGETQIHYVRAGSGPPVLLLHGFPQTHAMWHAVAPELAGDFTVVAADLRGYGASSKPQGTEAYRFREMAVDMVQLMAKLGYDTFHTVGHDRGGRVAHRLTLDFPDAVKSLTVMDIVPTHHLLAHVTKEVAAAYYHWFFLAQPYPFPETLIGHDPDAYFESCLLGWGSATLDNFDAGALGAYRAAWSEPNTIRGMCADYRAALTLDIEDDAKDLSRCVDAPSLVLYGADGVMAKYYDIPETWAPRLSQMTAQSIPGGHFFIDQSPGETAAALGAFLRVQPIF